MTFPTRFRIARTGRRVMVTLSVIALLGSVVGVPAPLRSSDDAQVDFPCRNRPCACATAEQCWRGACCCFTMEEKFAWAIANGVRVPSYAGVPLEGTKTRPTTRAGADRESSAHGQGCCPSRTAKREKRPPSPRKLVIGLFALRCQGQSGALLVLQNLYPPPLPVLSARDRLPCGSVASVTFHSTRILRCPPVPPPRIS